MSSQGPDSEKFNQKDKTLSCGGYQEALRILEEDALLARKLDNLHLVTTKYVPMVHQDSLEAEILQHLMPHAYELLQSIFERAIDTAMDSSQGRGETLSVLKDYMQMAMKLMLILDGLLDFIVTKNKISLADVRSVPLNVSKMLCVTFLHCKESTNFYKVHFDSLDEILALFKLAQDVHAKLLRVVDAHIIFNCVLEDDLLLLKLVLETLVDTGAILADINIKSMVLNLKAYFALTNKHADELKEHLAIRRPLSFLSKEIIKNLEAVTRQQGERGGRGAAPQTIKLIKFLLKLALNLCGLFWRCLGTCFDEVWDFLVSFYSFSDAQLTFKGVERGTIDLIKSELFDYVDQFLAKLCNEADFIQISNFADVIRNTNNAFGFLVLFDVLLRKLLLQKENGKIDDFPSALELVFDTIDKCYTEIITDDVIYENLVTAASAYILLNGDRYPEVESVLCKNLLGPNVWCSLIAGDVWILVFSRFSPDRKAEVLIEITEHSKFMMKFNFTHSPNFSVLCGFIKGLYRTSPAEVKLKFVERFPPTPPHVSVWKHIGVVNFPEHYRGSLSQVLIEKMERFDANRCTCEEFTEMCEHMEAVSTIKFEEVYLDVNKLSSLTLKLWDFDASNVTLLDNNFFKLYIQGLCNLTSSLMWKWTNPQLLQILQQLKLLLNNSSSASMKLLVLKLLNNVSTKLIESTDERRPMINTTLSELFGVLFNDGNCVIRQDALETFVAFINGALHDDVVHNTLSKEGKSLRDSISNFVQRKTTNDNAGGDFGVFLRSTGEKKFVHRCADWSTSSGPQSKKLKLCSEARVLKVQNTAETVALLQRIKGDVNYFCRLCERSDLSREQLRDISSIVAQLQGFVCDF